MVTRILVAGGLKEHVAWDAYARALGEHLAKAGVQLTLPWSSTFGRAMVEGFAKSGATGVRAYPGESEKPPEALAPFAVEPLPENLAGPLLEQALRECDVVLLAGNGSGLPEIWTRALRRRVPVVPLPIEQTTTHDLWERALREAPLPFPSMELRNAFFALRRPDPRSMKSSEGLAALLVGLAKAPAIAAGPRVLAVGVSAEAIAGGDDAQTVVARALATKAPGARIEEAAVGWLRSPGRAFADAVKRADLVVLELAPGVPAPLYGLGLARGAEKPVVAFARRDAKLAADPGALDAVLYESDRELAAKLERKLGEALKPREPRGEDPRPKRGPKRGKRRPRRERKPTAAAQAPKDATPNGDTKPT